MIPFTQAIAGVAAFYSSLTPDQKVLLNKVFADGVFPVMSNFVKVSPEVLQMVAGKATPLEHKLVAAATQVPFVNDLLNGKLPEAREDIVGIKCPECSTIFFKELRNG